MRRVQGDDHGSISGDYRAGCKFRLNKTIGVYRKADLMATTRRATTHWEGSLMEGAGRVNLDSSGLGGYDVTWASRAEDPHGRTSPEELIAAAHSACFSMALSHALAQSGNAPEALDTVADVTFQPGEGITGIHLGVKGSVPGLSSEQFAEAAEAAKANCPVSKALTGTTITLDATLA